MPVSTPLPFSVFLWNFLFLSQLSTALAAPCRAVVLASRRIRPTTRRFKRASGDKLCDGGDGVALPTQQEAPFRRVLRSLRSALSVIRFRPLQIDRPAQPSLV